ncbi:hypothetical protein ABZ721_15205 [Streptomyces sp. NPDC006733]|uniref:hypothetical protein n=1 Tax=Streptomyces sp. NPDC006733 TaxID=3155460 RepID=UPI0033EB4A62
MATREVLADLKRADKLTDAGRRALSPLFWIHRSPCSQFAPDRNRRLDLDLFLREMVPRPRTLLGEAANITVLGAVETAVLAQLDSVTSPIS